MYRYTRICHYIYVYVSVWRDWIIWKYKNTLLYIFPFYTHTHIYLLVCVCEILFECLCVYIYIYIYIYIFTNLISTSIHGTIKKTKKKTSGTRDNSISNHRPGEKEKIIGQKERKGQPCPTPWKKSRDTQSVVKRKLKTFPNPAMLQLLKCSTQVEPFIKLT